MNMSNAGASKGLMLTRRNFLIWAGSATAVIAASGSGIARAQAAGSVEVKAGSHALGGVVAAVLGSAGRVSVDESLGADTIQIAGVGKAKVTDRVLLKGQGTARDRYLDDARNAPRVAINVQHAVAEARPDLKGVLDANERAWAKPFAKQAFKWGRKLAASPVSGATISDAHGRVYLLEWAGAKVSSRGKPPPRALAGVPARPSAPTPAAYEAYLESLVSALTG